MCNEAARKIALGELEEGFAELRIPLDFPEGRPNLEAAASVRITDTTVIVRAGAQADRAEMVRRRWSWPGAGGRPVYNYRSEGRSFGNGRSGGRCLIPLDGFYEFTTPKVAEGAPKPKRKDKWLFTPREGSAIGTAFFCVAGLWRSDAQVGEAFTMLTCEPGPDIAPYHSRQIVLLRQADWPAWLEGVVPAAELIAPTPGGTLEVARVGGPEAAPR